MGHRKQLHDKPIPVKEGDVLSERDQILKTFARTADISLEDAQHVLNGQTEGLKPDKVAAFNAAVSEEYGDVDTFTYYYESLEADGPG